MMTTNHEQTNNASIAVVVIVCRMSIYLKYLLFVRKFVVFFSFRYFSRKHLFLFYVWFSAKNSIWCEYEGISIKTYCGKSELSQHTCACASCWSRQFMFVAHMVTATSTTPFKNCACDSSMVQTIFYLVDESWVWVCMCVHSVHCASP